VQMAATVETLPAMGFTAAELRQIERENALGLMPGLPQ